MIATEPHSTWPCRVLPLLVTPPDADALAGVPGLPDDGADGYPGLLRTAIARLEHVLASDADGERLAELSAGLGPLADGAARLGAGRVTAVVAQLRHERSGPAAHVAGWRLLRELHGLQRALAPGSG
jgi:hypothetical protein